MECIALNHGPVFYLKNTDTTSGLNLLGLHLKILKVDQTKNLFICLMLSI